MQAQLGPFSFEQFCAAVQRFHGSLAPGVLVGGFLVELARRSLPPGILFEALCETSVCLPDAVPLLTPCSIGNGRLRIAHVGRFALALHDKCTGEGVRTWVDPRCLEPWPELRKWFLKRKPKAEQDAGRLIHEIEAAGTSILGRRQVAVDRRFITKTSVDEVGICPGCGESFPLSDDEVCGGCRGALPYVTSRSFPASDDTDET